MYGQEFYYDSNTPEETEQFLRQLACRLVIAETVPLGFSTARSSANNVSFLSSEAALFHIFCEPCLDKAYHERKSLGPGYRYILT